MYILSKNLIYRIFTRKCHACVEGASGYIANFSGDMSERFHVDVGNMLWGRGSIKKDNVMHDPLSGELCYVRICYVWWPQPRPTVTHQSDTQRRTADRYANIASLISPQTLASLHYLAACVNCSKTWQIYLDRKIVTK